MKNLTKALALILALTLILTVPIGVSAMEADDTIIDEYTTGSLTIYKIDITNAEKDGVWDSSYNSTGIYDQSVYDTLIGTNRAGDTDDTSDLGNGNTSHGYAIAGVEFSYLRIADLTQYTETAQDGSTKVQLLYGIDKTKGADFLKALNLADGKSRYENADTLDETKYFYQSDVLIDALSAALTANATTVKNALEAYVKQGGTAMPLTDSYGKTSATDLPVGLYLIVETKVPEMVVSTTDPFLVSIPMTTVNGSNATDGGSRWMYDVTIFPKNRTGIPTLEKSLRENKEDTGKHNGTADLTDGYAHTGTASAGDTIDYLLTSTLPSITSASTYLTEYSFIDTLSAGLSYVKNDVVLSFYTDKDCKNAITTWKEGDGKFTVTYSATEEKESVMTIAMTEEGLAEINTAKTVYTDANMVNSGYSDCTVKITYQAKMNSDDSLVYGDIGNPNDVVLVWRRTSSSYYDTLVDDAHVYVYGLELTKLFSDGKGDFSKVQFTLRNSTDGYYVQAEQDGKTGIYYVTGHAANKEDATIFTPVAGENSTGKFYIKGLEDDEYVLKEVKTDSGYVLPKEDITITITKGESSEVCDIYTSDVLGLVQNDPRYAEIIHDTGDLHNMPQKQLEHKHPTAKADVDQQKNVVMLEDDGSANALVKLEITNTKGFNLPATGDRGVWMYGVIGAALMILAGTILYTTYRKKQ